MHNLHQSAPGRGPATTPVFFEKAETTMDQSYSHLLPEPLATAGDDYGDDGGGCCSRSEESLDCRPPMTARTAVNNDGDGDGDSDDDDDDDDADNDRNLLRGCAHGMETDQTGEAVSMIPPILAMTTATTTDAAAVDDNDEERRDIARERRRRASSRKKRRFNCVGTDSSLVAFVIASAAVVSCTTTLGVSAVSAADVTGVLHAGSVHEDVTSFASAGSASVVTPAVESNPSSPSSKNSVVFRVFQALPAEPSDMDAAELERVVSATRAMVLDAPPPTPSSHSASSSTYDNHEEDHPWAGVSVALDLYSPSERREYLVARGNRCHPDAHAASSAPEEDGGGTAAAAAFYRESATADRRAGGGGAAGRGGRRSDGEDDGEETFLAWYDVLARYDELLASSKTLFAAYDTTTKVDESRYHYPSPSSRSKARELERIASELWKFCVLYNGDGHAFLDYDGGALLRPLWDVVHDPIEGNWAVLADDAASRAEGEGADFPGVGGTDTASSSNHHHHYVHESFLSVSPKAPASSEIGSMIRLVLETSDDLLASSPLLLPREFHRLVTESSSSQAQAETRASNDADGKSKVPGDGEIESGGGGSAYWTLLTNECIELADPASGASKSSSQISNPTAAVPPALVTAEGGSDSAAAASAASSSSGLFAHPSSSTSLAGTGRSTPDARARRDAALCPLSGTGRYCCSVSSPTSSMSTTTAAGSGGGGGFVVAGGGVGGGSEGSSSFPALALRHPVGGRSFTSVTSGGSSSSSMRVSGGKKNLPYKLRPVDHRAVEVDSSPGGSENESDGQPGATASSSTSPQTIPLAGVPEADLDYISTVRLIVNDTDTAANQQSHPSATPNFFDILFENDCLPYRKECHRCLKDVENEAPEEPGENDDEADDATTKSTNPQTTPDPYDYDYEDDEYGDDLLRGRPPRNACAKCQSECPCYCDVLCKVRPPPKRISKIYAVRPPRYRKHVERLVPRIVHQTWFEPVTREGYPNMSRLIESWKKSGWEYNFYDDETAGEFLGMHFPPEVREAYDSVTPGAFKADLFRYCVLLIRGGVYADMDVMLQTNLDDAVANDIGFMTPIDEPGIDVGHRSCLWNGFIASAPGHPFLARTIEIAVNNIRNRFTSVDYDDMLCPDPILSVSHTVDTLFTCGPCILGAGINDVLGRHMQTQFDIGDVDVWQTEREELRRKRPSLGTDAGGASGGGGGGSGVAVDPDDPRLLVPGRTVILEQNKNDMGAHRFTLEERHLIIAATDMPDYDDRPVSIEHYSKTHEKAGVYGLRKLYTDGKRANEEIRIVVEEL